jgi:hypothetical protein
MLFSGIAGSFGEILIDTETDSAYLRDGDNAMPARTNGTCSGTRPDAPLFRSKPSNFGPWTTFQAGCAEFGSES